ncbi:MAG: cyclodeaminase/cyclohydrolase family protein [Thermodesulfobacteriota bacterium]
MTEMKIKELTVETFVHRLAQGSATPGGGSVAALSGALSASLCAMVGRLTAEKPKYRQVWAEMEEMVLEADRMAERLLDLADQDIAAYDQVMAAMKMPKTDPKEQESRTEAIQRATRQATLVPLNTLKILGDLVGFIEKAVTRGNLNCLSDAGVALVLTRGAALGASYNVRINLLSIKDLSGKKSLKTELDLICDRIFPSLERLGLILEERLG